MFIKIVKIYQMIHLSPITVAFAFNKAITIEINVGTCEFLKIFGNV